MIIFVSRLNFFSKISHLTYVKVIYLKLTIGKNQGLLNLNFFFFS